MSNSVKMPPFVAMRSPRWGRGGSGYGSYLAALLDVASLDAMSILGIDANTDMFVGLLGDAWSVGHYVAVETDLVTAAFFASQIDERDDIELFVSGFDERRAETMAAIEPYAPFDAVVVRTDPSKLNAAHLGDVFATTRTLVRDRAKLVIGLALGVTTVSGKGAGDRLADREVLDSVGDYLEYEWELGTIPVYAPAFLRTFAAEHGWRIDEMCEPRRGFPQHHVVLSASD